MIIFNTAPDYYLIMVQSSYITPKLCGKLHLKSIASRDITIKVFGHQVLHKETIDCVEYV